MLQVQSHFSICKDILKIIPVHSVDTIELQLYLKLYCILILEKKEFGFSISSVVNNNIIRKVMH